MQFEVDCEPLCVLLGRTVVRIRSKDAQLLADLAPFLLPAKSSADAKLLDLETLDFPDNPAKRGGRALEAIITFACNAHSAFVYVDAAALCSSAGKVLIAAESMSGKSTLAIYAALSSEWKVMAEDRVFIDSQTNMIIPFCGPFSLRKGSKRLLAESCLSTPQPLMNDRYYFDESLFAPHEVPGPFDVLVILEAQQQTQFRYEKLSTGAALREILKLSNAIVHGAEAMEALHNSIVNADCFRVFGGTLSERLQLINEAMENRKFFRSTHTARINQN